MANEAWRIGNGRTLATIVLAGGSCKSFLIAAKLLKSFLQVEISAKQVSLLTTMVGSELQESRDGRTDAWQNRQLTQPKTVADPRLHPSNRTPARSFPIHPTESRCGLGADRRLDRKLLAGQR